MAGGGAASRMVGQATRAFDGKVKWPVENDRIMLDEMGIYVNHD